MLGLGDLCGSSGGGDSGEVEEISDDCIFIFSI